MKNMHTQAKNDHCFGLAVAAVEDKERKVAASTSDLYHQTRKCEDLSEQKLKQFACETFSCVLT